MSNVEQFNLNGITVDVCDANARDMIGDKYDATATYAVGEYCIYNNTMKKCITAVSTPEAFDSEKWINTTIQEVLEAANTKIGTASLNTSASDLSGAINEHETDIGRIEYDLGSETLPDTTKTVKGNINAISNNLTNLVKEKHFEIKCSDMSNGMYLTNYLNLDTGYKLLSWNGAQSVGWVAGFPIYVTDVNRVWWNGTLDTGSNSYVRFIYLEIRDL